MTKTASKAGGSRKRAAAAKPKAAEQKAAAAAKAEATETVAAPDGPAVFKKLLTAAARVGEVLPHKKGAYARVKADGRTVAYIVAGKRIVNVYPQALAASMPSGIDFRKVELGAHHYGSGEVVVPVMDGEAALDNAVAALKAAKALPPIPRNAKAAAPSS